MVSEHSNIFVLSKQDTNVMKGIAIIAMLCHHVYTCQPEWVEVYPFILTTMGVLGKVCVAYMVLISCLLISILIEYLKDKIYWNKLTKKIVVNIK